MNLSFNDEESFKEAVSTLCFNIPPSDPSDPDTLQPIGSMPSQDSEWNDDVY